jgi:hypothetical protein
MSASFNKIDNQWLRSIFKQGKFDKVELAMLESLFDEHTDEDARTLENNQKQEKLLRRICIYKFITFPVEILAILVTLGLDKAIEHKDLTKLYLQYFNKKITLYQFQVKLHNFGETGKIL